MFSVHKYWHLALFGKNRKEVRCCCVCLDTFMLVESAGGGGGGGASTYIFGPAEVQGCSE